MTFSFDTSFNSFKTCNMCTNDCLECLNPGSYCRQCIYPMSLDTSTHRCLECCSTNLTTNDCCQCPLSWDGKRKFHIHLTHKFLHKGFCLHPLATPVSPGTQWFKSSFNQIRTKFSRLNSSRQMILILAIILVSLSLLICLITMSLRQIFTSRLSSRQEQHNNVEYVMLQNVDDNDDDEPRSIATNGHRKSNLTSKTSISFDHVQET